MPEQLSVRGVGVQVQLRVVVVSENTVATFGDTVVRCLVGQTTRIVTTLVDGGGAGTPTSRVQGSADGVGWFDLGTASSGGGSHTEEVIATPWVRLNITNIGSGPFYDFHLTITE